MVRLDLSDIERAAGVRREVDPLTNAELAAGGGFSPAISSVDMTPRTDYPEMRKLMGDRMANRMMARNGRKAIETKQIVHAEIGDVPLLNRTAALRSLHLASGDLAYWTQCACGWCGLRVADPELARREYDAHACAAEGIGQAAVDRAIAETDRTTLAKRPRAVLQPQPQAVTESTATPVVVDDTEARFALLEMK